MSAKSSGHELAIGIAAQTAAIVTVCLGASLAKQLFPLVGAAGTTALRVAFSALILAAVWRPWRMRLGRSDLGRVALYGAMIGAMNLQFYLAIERIPLGLAIAVQFSGPLALALVSSRRAADLVWVALAAVGVVMLLPIGIGVSDLDPLGVGFALGAGAVWAFYIVCGKRVGHLHGGRTVALGMVFAAMIALPVGVATAGTALLDPKILLFGALVAVVSSALPYSLEMEALKRIPRNVFGVFLSLEPAVGALAGLLILNERLSLSEGFAIGCVVAASVGVALGAARAARVRALAESTPA